MNRLIKLIIIYFVFQPNYIFSQMQLDWVKIYNGSYLNGSDAAYATTVDKSGNVYVTGGSEVGSSIFSCITIKYNKIGEIMWLKEYYRSGNFIGFDIVVDDSNNVFVACGAIIKYDKNGNFIWENYDSTAYRKILVDSLSNIYAGGRSSGKLTVGKYNKDGIRVWRKKYSFSGSAGTDNFGGLTKDNMGNIIITGDSKSNTTFYDYATIKYSNDGNLLWSRRYNGPSSYSDDGARGITSDINRNVYVTGFSMDSLNHDNCLTIKYDSSGNVVWINRIPSIAYIANVGYNLAMDSFQNLIIAGRLNGYTTIIKVNTLVGNIIWSRIYPEGNVFTDNFPVVVLDSINNIYTTGISTVTGAADYAAIKYDSSGNQIYVVKYNSSDIRFDYVYDLAIDKKGSVYLTGEVSASSGNYGTVKFSEIMTNLTNSNTNVSDFKLEQNYPNPFNPGTIISYSIPVNVKSEMSNVKLKVYDILGNEVATLVNERKNAGRYEVEFNGSNFPSGIYFYSLTVDGNLIDTKKMILLK